MFILNECDCTSKNRHLHCNNVGPCKNDRNVALLITNCSKIFRIKANYSIKTVAFPTYLNTIHREGYKSTYVDNVPLWDTILFFVLKECLVDFAAVRSI